MTAGDGSEVVWRPPADVRRSTVVGRYLDWLQRERALAFSTYAELWQWSVDDLPGFWSSIWSFFGVRSSATYEAVLRHPAMPGTEWFPGSRLNYAEHALATGGEGPAVIARSQSGEERRLTWDQLRDQVGRCRAGLGRLGVRRGDRVVAYLPNGPEALVAFLATASLGAVWASCPPEFGVRSVTDRFGQLDPVVLLMVRGYRYGAKSIDRSAEVDAIVDVAAHAAGGGGRRQPVGGSWWASRPSPPSTPCRSTTRSTCSSPRGRPGCRRPSSTATAGSCSSTSRRSPSTTTWAPATGSSGSRRPGG